VGIWLVGRTKIIASVRLSAAQNTEPVLDRTFFIENSEVLRSFVN
jgi:hypothetical protein